MMKYPTNVLLRRLKFNFHNLMFNKTMFIRSLDNSNAKTTTSLLQQPYAKYFVLDFEATCDNKMHLIKPQVSNCTILNLFKFMYLYNRLFCF